MRLAAGCSLAQAGQTDGKLATLSGASTGGYYGSSVRLYKIAHQRQTDAQPGARAVICLIRLPKQIEYAW